MEKIKIYKIVSSTIIVIGLLAILALTITKDEQRKDNSDFIKTNFMAGCIDDGNYQLCECIYDELQSDLGMEGFIALSLEIDETGDIPKEAYKAVANCVK